jgi:hypothetical protein
MAQPPQLRGNGFKPGNALNSRPVGTEITSCRGYAMVKIDNQPHDNKKNWKPKHSVIWENAHGAIPKGSVVIFADGDKSNFALDNLLLISRGELAVMSHCGLFSPDRELTKAGKLIADIKIQIARREREGAPRPGEECNVG